MYASKMLFGSSELGEAQRLLNAVRTSKFTDDITQDFSGIAKSNLEMMRAELARARVPNGSKPA
jgi:hypothetical protein